MKGCHMCDGNGMAMVLPETKHAWETVARCPHNAAALLELKRQAEADQAALTYQPPQRQFSEPLHSPDEVAS